MNGEEITAGTCDVCYILEGDERQKIITYCEKCQAWICEECIPKTLRRFHAMAKRKFLSAFGVHL